MKTKFLAACFDLDGTLIDTESIHVKAEGECLKSFDVDPGSIQRPRTFGMGIEPGLQLLADTFNLDFNSVLKNYMVFWEDGLHYNLNFLPGADAVLSWLSEYGIPLALVTSSSAEYVDLVDSSIRLRNRFQVVITSDNTQCLKPNPMAYNKAVRELEIPSENCVGFEDSGAGIKALNAAGLFSVAVHPDYKIRAELQTAKLLVTDLGKIQSFLESWFFI
jgi:HAD superfamily hydrolase (TIGR01509 family)